MATVQTAIVSDESFSISMGDGSSTAEAVRNDGKGVIVDPRDVGVTNLEDDQHDDDNRDDLGEGADAGDAGDDATGAETPSDLGEYSDDKFDQFDTAYRTDTGTLNLTKLSAEFFSNADPEAKTPGKLNEGTYQFLEATLGVSREDIQAFEQGQLAIRQNYYNTVTQEAGGLAVVQTMVEWGKENFSPEAKRRFNEAYHSGDPERASDALASLQARYTRATGKNPSGQQRRPVNPRRSATAQGQSPGTQTSGYATRAEWVEARTAAKGNPKALAEVDKKLRASPRSKWAAV